MSASNSAYKTLIAAALVTFLGMAGMALPFPILAPLFLESPDNQLTQFMGIDPKLLMSFILAVYPLGLLLGSSFIGAISDTYGRRKILTITLLVAAVGYIFSAVAIVQQDYLLLLISRFITGGCEGNVSIARAIAADLHPKIDKTKSMAWVYTATSAGWLLGPAAGGFLMPYGAEVAFYVAGFSLAFAAVVVLFTIPDEVKNTQLSVWKAIIKDNSVKLLSHKELKYVALIQLLFTLGINGFYEFYPVWLVENLQFNSIDIAMITVSLTIVMMINSALFMARIRNRFGKATSIIFGLTGLSLALTIMPFLNTWQSYAIFAICGIFISLQQNMFPVFVSDRYESLGNGRVLGLLTTIFCFSNVVIALIGGFIIVFNTNFIYWLSAILVLLAAIAFYRFDRSTEFNPNGVE